MNALEDRLRDALDAAACTVPDHATGPGLAFDGRTAHRPVRRSLVVLGAAAAVIAAVAIPLAIQAGTERKGLPATPVCPQPSPVQPSVPTSDGTKPYFGDDWGNNLPVGPPPRIPYTLTDDTGKGYLQDGTVRIQLAAGKRVLIIGKLECGLLVNRQPLTGRGGELGVLKPDGTFVRRSAAGDAVALSPDRTKIAVVPNGSRRLSIIDVSTGEEVTGRTVDPETGAYAWTKDGIWYADEEHYHEYAFVWRPGEEPRKLTHSADEFLPRTGTDLIVLGEVRDRCTDVLKLSPSGDTTVKVMERCGRGEERSMLSLDGRFLVTENGKAFRIPDNTPPR
jgi:hypothetical protein